MIDLNPSDEELGQWANGVAALLRDKDAPTDVQVSDYLRAIQKVDELLYRLRFYTDEEGLHLRHRGNRLA